MRKSLVITNNDYNETAVNPTVFDFDRLSGTGNDDEFFLFLMMQCDHHFQLEDFSFEDLYYSYISAFSGDKRMSSAVWKQYKRYSGEDEITIPSQIEYINFVDFENDCSYHFIARYDNELRRVYTALFAEYDPIMDYSLSEKENVGTKITTDSDSDVYGFNSTTSVPNAKSKITQQGTKNDNERVLERKGNIGATPQTMVESELRLRKQSFARFFFECLDEYFTTCAY